jgi:hypothetical protein
VRWYASISPVKSPPGPNIVAEDQALGLNESAPAKVVVADRSRRKPAFARSKRPKRQPSVRNHDVVGIIYGLLGFVILGFVLPIYAVPDMNVGHVTAAVADALVVYSALRLSVLLARGEPRLLECAFWTFAYSFLTLPLLAQITAQQFPLATSYSYNDRSSQATEVVIIVGLAGYEIGRLLFGKPVDPWGARQSAAERLRQSADENISIGKALTLAYIGLAFVAFAVLQHGLGSFFESRDALTENFLGSAQVGLRFYLNADKAAGTSLQALSQVPIFIGTYLLLYIRHARRDDPAADRPSWIVLMPLIVGNVVINNPIANARFWYGTVLIAFLTIYLPLRSRKSAVRLFVAVFVAISLFSFSQLAAFRHSGGANVSAPRLEQSLVSDPDYAVMNGVEYVQANGYQLGDQLLGTALILVPRKLWPGKPGDTGQLVGGDAGFKVSAPIWTEGEVDFGLAGTFAYLLVIGAFSLRLDRRYARSGAPNVLAAFAPVMAGLLVFLVRGSLQPAFGSLIPVIVCTAFCLKTDWLKTLIRGH